MRLNKAIRFSQMIVLLASVAVVSARAWGLADEPAPPTSQAAAVDPQLTEAKGQLAAIPADAAADSLAGQKRAALQKKVSLLEESHQLTEQKKLATADSAARAQRLAAAKKELDAFNAAVATTQPATQPTREGFEALKTQLAQKRDQVTQLKDAMAQRARRIEDLPGLIARAKARGDAAQKRIAELTPQIATAAQGEPRTLLELQLANARLDSDNAKKLSEALVAERAAAGGPESLPRTELALAERQLEVLQQEYSAYSASMGKLLADETLKQQQEVERQKQEAARATDPVAKFEAQMKSRIATAAKDKGMVEAFLLTSRQDIAEQQKRTTTDKEEQANLQELLKRTGGAVKASDRIKRLLETLRQRRQMLTRLIEAGMDEKVDDFRAKRFELEDRLFSLDDKWAESRDKAFAGRKDAAAEARARGLLNQLRAALQEEKEMLTDAIASGERLQSLYLERFDRLDELERTIRAKVFWLRDGKPMGPEVFQPVWTEGQALVAWAKELVSADSAKRIRDRINGPVALLYGLLLFPILPVGLFYLRRRLRTFVRERNRRALDHGANLPMRLLSLLIAVTSAALLPLYILLAGEFVESTGLPPTIGPVVSEALRQFAYFLFFWLVTRSILREGGVAQSQFGLNNKAALCLSRWLRVGLVGFILLLIPSRLLAGPPFEFSSSPRILYTLFEIVAGLCIIMTLRGNSPFVKKGIAPSPTHFFGKHWWFITFGVTALLLAILVLDLLGYRYAASSMAHSFSASLVTVTMILAVYAVVIKTLQRMSWSRRAVAAPGEKAASRWQVQIQLRRIVRWVFGLTAIFLVASYWGMDKQAFRILEDIRLMAVGTGDPQEYLTAADLVQGLLFAAGTFWVLWALPGIYEIAVFPRLTLDQGLKYAILTISRYGVFVIGIMLTLSAIHLDLSRLSWLMAAIGVGLGFGLQEIVSNFVSGIILLVERPVQVGDMVTIGTTQGRVQRINIRATTILNLDRQEVIVPNRSFITSEVTNWTRGDTINRLTIRIGVAYGTDVDRVTDLLMKIARDSEFVVQDPAPSVIFAQHGESSLDFELRLLVSAPDKMIVTQNHINKAINKVLAANNIEIPFPQRDIHIRSQPPT
jgi:potassium efflux system protein